MTQSLPTPVDHALLIVLFLLEMVNARWIFPAFLRAVAANAPRIRLRGYAVNIVFSWAFTAWVFALWISHGRPWTALFLGPIDPLRVGLGFAAPALYLLLMWAQIRTLLERPDGMERLRRQFRHLPPFFPRTPGERRGFVLVALTAGVCEEVIFRGFAIWYFTALTGLAAAVVLSTVLFGLCHIYLGRGPAIRAGGVGLLMAIVVVATHSLWPAIVWHALMDLVAGELAYRAFAEQR